MKKILSLVVLLMATVATYAQVFTDEAHITSAGMTTDYQSKEVELTKVADNLYSVTFRKLAPMAYKTFGDFTVANVKATADANGATKLTTESTEGVWSNVTSTAAIGGVTEGSSAQLNSFEATLSADGTELVLEFNFVALGSDVNVVFGEANKTPSTIVADYEFADKLVIYDPDHADLKVTDMEACHVFFDVYDDNTVRVKFNQVDLSGANYDLVFKGTFTTQTVDGQQQFACRGAEGDESVKTLFGGVAPTLDVDGVATGENTIYMSFRMHGNGMTYNGEFGTSPTTAITAPDAASDNRYVAIYTLGGVRCNNLQRGINIVRTASGKVKKVLVK